jgi:uncharacterized membrane protein YjjP (DUF1212 family)
MMPIENIMMSSLSSSNSISVPARCRENSQLYLVKLGRCLMEYGAPPHRLEGYLDMSAQALDIHATFDYRPGRMTISFWDASSCVSNVEIIKANEGLKLSKLADTHTVYKKVVHDVLSLDQAILLLDRLKILPETDPWLRILVYGLASASVAPFGDLIYLILVPQYIS